jgi:hypothetical protein
MSVSLYVVTCDMYTGVYTTLARALAAYAALRPTIVAIQSAAVARNRAAGRDRPAPPEVPMGFVFDARPNAYIDRYNEWPTPECEYVTVDYDLTGEWPNRADHLGFQWPAADSADDHAPFDNDGAPAPPDAPAIVWLTYNDSQNVKLFTRRAAARAMMMDSGLRYSPAGPGWLSAPGLDKTPWLHRASFRVRANSAGVMTMKSDYWIEPEYEWLVRISVDVPPVPINPKRKITIAEADADAAARGWE